MSPTPSPPRRLDEAQIAALLEQVGARRQPPEDAMAAAREAVHGAWRQEVEARRFARRRQWRGWAVAATLLLGLAIAFGINRPADPGAGSVQLAQVKRVIEVRSASAPGWHEASEQEALVPGDRLRSGPGSFALVELPRGVTLRVDEASEFELLAQDRVYLEAGAVYVDASGIGTLGVDTQHGSARDIGTQYEVRLLDAGWQVSVRDGAVVMADADRGEVQAVAGERLIVAGGEIDRRTVGPSDASWNWTHEALRPMAIEGRMLSSYLDWWSRESGVRVVYAKPIDASLAGQTRLHGDLGELGLDEGFRAVIAGAGFRVVDRDEEQVIVTN